MSEFNLSPPLDLPPVNRAEIARRKATCPFIGPAVRSGALPIYGSVDRPMAKIDDVAALGDSGGGSLGSRVLAFFATGNHSCLPNAAGSFDASTPDGMFSLDFPGSRGAHPGDSRILLENPAELESGRFSEEEFRRLAAFADEDGMLSVGAIGEFIAQNVARDPQARRLELARVFPLFGGALREGAEGLFDVVRGKASSRNHVEFLEALSALAPEDNILGSAGEFGLLFAFLSHRPDADDEDKIRTR